MVLNLFSNLPIRLARLIAGVAFALLCALQLFGATLTARLEQDSVTVGESINLELRFEGGSPAAVPQFARIAGLDISYVGKSSQWSMINGQTSSLLILQYLIRTSQPGQFTIPSTTAYVGNERLSTQPLKITVAKADPANGGPAGKVAYLQLVVPRKEVFVGEVFPLEVKLYAQNGRELNVTPLSADGFILGQAQKPTQTQTDVNGVFYNVVSIKQTASAVRSGDLKLGPAEWSLVVALPNQRRGQQDWSDQIASLLGDRGQLKRVTLNSGETIMKVLPLPSMGKPAGFRGSIGRFKMDWSATPTNVLVGDPVTLRLQISGSGNLDSIAAPNLQDLKDFKVYPPTSKSETTDSLGIEGSKTFEFVMVPQSTDVREIPPIEFNSFDPEARRYETARSESIGLVVKPVASGATPQLADVAAMPPSPTAPAANPLPPIKARLGTVISTSQPLVFQKWFLACQTLPLLALFTAAFLRKRSDWHEKNPVRVRIRKADQLATDSLKQLSELAAQGDHAGFHELLFRVLQEQLGARCGVAPASVTEELVVARLRGQLELPEALLERLLKTFHACNQARYASAGAREQLAAEYEQAREVITALMQWRPA